MSKLYVLFTISIYNNAIPHITLNNEINATPPSFISTGSILVPRLLVDEEVAVEEDPDVLDPACAVPELSSSPVADD